MTKPGSRNEADAPTYAAAITAAPIAAQRMSAANCLEAAVVVDGSRDAVASRRFDDFMREAAIAIEPVTGKVRRGWSARPIAISAKGAATRPI